MWIHMRTTSFVHHCDVSYDFYLHRTRSSTNVNKRDFMFSSFSSGILLKYRGILQRGAPLASYASTYYIIFPADLLPNDMNHELKFNEKLLIV